MIKRGRLVFLALLTVALIFIVTYTVSAWRKSHSSELRQQPTKPGWPDMPDSTEHPRPH